MSTEFEVVAGTTSPIDITLLSKGATPTGTMVGMTATLILRSLFDDSLVDVSGDVTVTDTTNWIVRYTPDAADLTPGRYRGRIKVTDGTGLINYFPSGDWDYWTVRAA